MLVDQIYQRSLHNCTVLFLRFLGRSASECWGRAAQFLFTGLEDIKPEMIAEATADARRAANQFAADSDARIGAIRSARQGFFSINERDPSTPEVKVVRVVTTIEYILD